MQMGFRAIPPPQSNFLPALVKLRLHRCLHSTVAVCTEDYCHVDVLVPGPATMGK